MAERLNQIETIWAMVHGSYAEETSVARDSRSGFLQRYGPAAKRYLLGAVRDAEAADELYQEFALRYLRGDLRTAHPDRGRFRSYLKSILYRMVADYFRDRRRDVMISLDLIEPAASEVHVETPHVARRRTMFLQRSNEILKEIDKSAGKSYYRAFRLRVDQPELRSTEFATALSGKLGRAVSPAHARVMVHRAREQFASILLDEIAASLSSPSKARLEEELMSLGLLPYCAAALDKYCD